jgi:hypothetical protein
LVKVERGLLDLPSVPTSDDETVVEISGLLVTGKQVPLDVPFEAGDDWLARLVFRIINRGPKPIAGMVITIGLFERVDEELPMYESYGYGLKFIRIKAVRTKQRLTLRTLVDRS